MNCRTRCGACCIAPSISSPIPGMPNGKPAGIRCVQLTSDLKCALYGLPERPRICVGFAPDRVMCGQTADDAIRYLSELERITSKS